MDKAESGWFNSRVQFFRPWTISQGEFAAFFFSQFLAAVTTHYKLSKKVVITYRYCGP